MTDPGYFAANNHHPALSDRFLDWLNPDQALSVCGRARRCDRQTKNLEIQKTANTPYMLDYSGVEFS
jgi:hypothetical protein